MKKRILSLLLSLSLIIILIVLVVIVGTLPGKFTPDSSTISQDEYPAPVAKSASTLSAFQNAYLPPGNQSAYPPPVVTPKPLSGTSTPETHILYDPAYGSVSPMLARPYLDSDQAIFLDVRSAESYANSHIAGAISIPQAEVPTRLDELDPNKLIIIYCS